MCWGANGSAQLGVAGGNGPVKVPGVSAAQSLALGDRHSCAATAAGIFCWGANEVGQLGQGGTGATAGPAPVTGIGAATSISAGTAFTCAVSGGELYCWGTNSTYQFGESSTPEMLAAPFHVNVPAPTTAVAAGDGHACAIGPTSKLYCWGLNSSGQVGDGKPDLTLKVAGIGLSSSLVAAGASHTCAVSGGAAFCWGANNFGQLGMISPDPTKPFQVGTISAVQRIALGANHSCAQNGDGAVYCWGNNVSGQAGPPAGGTVLTPRPINN
jgi:alpha-tubulin suppressor-like RCC1 family protein